MATTEISTTRKSEQQVVFKSEAGNCGRSNRSVGTICGWLSMDFILPSNQNWHFRVGNQGRASDALYYIQGVRAVLLSGEVSLTKDRIIDS